MSAACNGARYSRAAPRSSGPPVIPASTNSTNRGHAWVVSVTPVAAANASSYAWLSIVARVPMTATLMPFMSRTANSGRAGSVVPFL